MARAVDRRARSVPLQRRFLLQEKGVHFYRKSVFVPVVGSIQKKRQSERLSPSRQTRSEEPVTQLGPVAMNDSVVQSLLRRGIPVNRENYLALHTRGVPENRLKTPYHSLTCLKVKGIKKQQDGLRDSVRKILEVRGKRNQDLAAKAARFREKLAKMSPEELAELRRRFAPGASSSSAEST